jgi:hypothetical protein
MSGGQTVVCRICTQCVQLPWTQENIEPPAPSSPCRPACAAAPPRARHAAPRASPPRPELAVSHAHPTAMTGARAHAPPRARRAACAPHCRDRSSCACTPRPPAVARAPASSSPRSRHRSLRHARPSRVEAGLGGRGREEGHSGGGAELAEEDGGASGGGSTVLLQAEADLWARKRTRGPGASVVRLCPVCLICGGDLVELWGRTGQKRTLCPFGYACWVVFCPKQTKPEGRVLELALLNTPSVKIYKSV